MKEMYNIYSLTANSKKLKMKEKKYDKKQKRNKTKLYNEKKL